MIRLRVRATVIPLVGACLVLSGCSTLWPTMMTDRELKVSGGAALNCHKTVNVDGAFECLNAAKEEMGKAIANIDKYDRALGYTAVVGGTMAGHQLVKTAPSSTVLKDLGVGLAGLVGFDKVVGSDKQLTAYDAGMTALLCIDKAARGVQTVEKAIAQSSIMRQALGGQTPGVFATANVAAISNPAHQTYMTQQVTTYAASYRAALSNLRQAAAAASDDVTLAERVRSAVVRIRAAILTQLGYKRIDLRELFKEQQQRVGEIVGEIVSATQKTQTATNTLNVYLVAAGGEPVLSPADVAKPATDAYEACIAPLPK